MKPTSGRMEWVRAFNPYDLYSKGHEPPDVEKLRPFYEDLIAEFFPSKLRVVTCITASCPASKSLDDRIRIINAPAPGPTADVLKCRPEPGVIGQSPDLRELVGGASRRSSTRDASAGSEFSAVGADQDRATPRA